MPLALLFLSNRVLNPALVLIEVALNAYVLWVNRDALGKVWRRVLPIVIGLVPGVIVGTLIVSRVSPAWLKLWTYIVLLPLILLQAAGYRRPIRAERSVGLPFGLSIGVLYSVTTISGPPLAVMLNNQGLAKREFRAALGFIRLAESTFTAIAYFTAGLITTQSLALIPQILPSVAHRRADRRVADSPDEGGNIPPPLHELRRLGGGVWRLDRLARPQDRGGPGRLSVPARGHGHRRGDCSTGSSRPHATFDLARTT